jgi:hypothetical protein
MLGALIASLAATEPEMVEQLGEKSAFCKIVARNHGCCPACGYEWIDGTCVSKKPATTAYCKSLLAPKQAGCCRYCEYEWTGSKCEHDSLAVHRTLASFAPDASDSHTWVAVNDPVMGGASESTIVVQHEVGNWSGEVRVVKSLGAPGFCTVRTTDSNAFPDARGTTHIGLALAGWEGLPQKDFSIELGVRGVTNPQTLYHAMLTKESCCRNDCRLPWSAFRLSFRGKPVDGPPLSEHLDKIAQLGLGTSGQAGKFSVSMSSFYATTKALGACVTAGVASS